MEPRARIGRNRGQQNFSDQECKYHADTSSISTNLNLVQHFLFAHGDVPQSLDSTKRVLDEIITDFITEMCFEAARSAQIANRQKIKVDDVKFACRKNPAYLGKIQEIFDKKAELATVRKIFDANDDKITKSNVKALEEEPLNDADDDMDLDIKGSIKGGIAR